MERRTLGRTGVQVSPLCLGAMMFGAWGNTDHDDSVRIIHRALDAGINFVDTADVYSAGESEEIVGRALQGRRDDVVLATKVHGSMGADPNRQGNSRRWIISACEESLRRLGTDWIDLYQIHRPDPRCDIDETLGALSDLVRAGKVRYVGSSTFPPSDIVEAQWTAERRGRERFVCEQPPYSILVRGIEREVLPVCQRHRMGVISWSPLAGGWLTGRFRKGQDLPVSHRAQRIPARYDMSLPGNQLKLVAADELAVLAEDAGISLVHLALAFVLRHPAVTAAIIGPRTMEQLESQLGSDRGRARAPRCSTPSTASSPRGRPSALPTPAGSLPRSPIRHRVDADDRLRPTHRIPGTPSQVIGMTGSSPPNGRPGRRVSVEPVACASRGLLGHRLRAGAFLAGAFLATALRAGAFLAGAFLAAALRPGPSWPGPSWPGPSWPGPSWPGPSRRRAWPPPCGSPPAWPEAQATWATRPGQGAGPRPAP